MRCFRRRRCFHFDVFWNNLHLTCLPYFWWEDLVYCYIFTSQREFHSVPDVDLFYSSLILAQLELSRIELPKLTPSISMEYFSHFVCPGWSMLFLYVLSQNAWLFKRFIFELDESLHSLKITYLLLRQVISLKKILLLSTKFTNLISWSPISVPLILLFKSMKLTSLQFTIMYRSIESGHPWWTPRIRVNGSDRRPFILILHWLLVHATLIMFINLSPYANFCKPEKITPQSNLSKILMKSKYIIQKSVCSVYLTQRLCHK